MAQIITDNNFEELVKKEGVVVDFWANWCGPCKIVGPIVDQISKDYEGKALVGKVDVDENPLIASEYGIRNIPAIFIFKDGEIVDKHIGVGTKAALSAKIDAVLEG